MDKEHTRAAPVTALTTSGSASWPALTFGDRRSIARRVVDIDALMPHVPWDWGPLSGLFLGGAFVAGWLQAPQLAWMPAAAATVTLLASLGYGAHAAWRRRRHHKERSSALALGVHEALAERSLQTAKAKARTRWARMSRDARADAVVAAMATYQTPALDEQS